METNSLKTLQHNVQFWSNNRGSYVDAYLEMDPDEILLNSTGVRDGDHITIPVYTVHQNNLNSSGSVIAVKSSVAVNRV